VCRLSVLAKPCRTLSLGRDYRLCVGCGQTAFGFGIGPTPPQLRPFHLRFQRPHLFLFSATDSSWHRWPPAAKSEWVFCRSLMWPYREHTRVFALYSDCGQDGNYTAYDGGPSGSNWYSTLKVNSGPGAPPGPNTFYQNDSCGAAACIPFVANQMNSQSLTYVWFYQNSNSAAGMMLSQCGLNVTLPVLGPTN
jgi:hypothetical protein